MLDTVVRFRHDIEQEVHDLIPLFYLGQHVPTIISEIEIPAKGDAISDINPHFLVFR
jgi:hypothetical protein